MTAKKGSNIASSIGEIEKDSPWPNNEVDWLKVKMAWVKKLKTVIDAAADERPIQKYLEEHPDLLGQLLGGGQGRWVFPKPKFGSEFVPDFLLCDRDSDGFHWKAIELENPNYAPLNGKGSQSGKFAIARRQIGDWRTWLWDNIAYARDKFTDIDGECQSIIIIGRRKMRRPEHQKRYRDLSSDPRLTVMSYDRFFEQIEATADAHVRLAQRRG
jgi:hypothetical protein